MFGSGVDAKSWSWPMPDPRVQPGNVGFRCTAVVDGAALYVGKGSTPAEAGVGDSSALVTFNGRSGMAYAKARPVETHHQEHNASSQDSAAMEFCGRSFALCPASGRDQHRLPAPYWIYWQAKRVSGSLQLHPVTGMR
jgi:hypothetical protein